METAPAGGHNAGQEPHAPKRNTNELGPSFSGLLEEEQCPLLILLTHN